MGHLLVAEKIERAILFNLRASNLYNKKKNKKYIFSKYSFYFYRKDISYNAASKNCYKIGDVPRVPLTSFYIYLYHFLTLLLII